MDARTRKRYSFWMEPDHAAALKELKERDGLPESEQIRRALADWFQKRGITLKTGKPAKKGR